VHKNAAGHPQQYVTLSPVVGVSGPNGWLGVSARARVCDTPLGGRARPPGQDPAVPPHVDRTTPKGIQLALPVYFSLAVQLKLRLKSYKLIPLK
jgi:hypothetical protein